MTSYQHVSLAVVASSSIDTTEGVITRSELKTHLRLDDDVTAEDAALDMYALAAEKRLEERWGRAFLKKTYDYTVDLVPSSTGAIKLPKSPLVSIASITSYDDENTATVMSTSEWRTDTASEPGRVVCNDEYEWPDDLRIQGAVTIRFVAGYSTAPSGIPEGIKLATLATAAHLYEHRGDDGLLDVPALVKLFDEEYALPEVY